MRSTHGLWVDFSNKTDALLYGAPTVTAMGAFSEPRGSFLFNDSTATIRGRFVSSTPLYPRGLCVDALVQQLYPVLGGNGDYGGLCLADGSFVTGGNPTARRVACNAVSSSTPLQLVQVSALSSWTATPNNGPTTGPNEVSSVWTVCMAGTSPGRTLMTRDQIVLYNVAPMALDLATASAYVSVGDYADDVYRTAALEFFWVRARRWVPLASEWLAALSAPAPARGAPELVAYAPLNLSAVAAVDAGFAVWANFSNVALALDLAAAVQVTRVATATVAPGAVDMPAVGALRWRPSDALFAGETYEVQVDARQLSSGWLYGSATVTFRFTLANALLKSATNPAREPVDPLNNLSDAANIRSASSSISLLLMTCGALALALAVTSALTRTARARRVSAHPEAFVPISVTGFIVRRHTILAFALDGPARPMSLCASLVLHISAAWLVAALLDLRSTVSGTSAAYVRLNAAALLSGLLNSAASFAVGLLFALHWIRNGLRSPVARVRHATAVVSSAVSLLMCGCALGLLFARAAWRGGSPRVGATLVSVAISSLVSLSLFEPVSSVAVKLALGITHVERRDHALKTTAAVAASPENIEQVGGVSDDELAIVESSASASSHLEPGK
eukprot:Amastigsp_a1137_20.p1 type:complete len:621 gc:universal Amastigsp_a1137_20:3469-1607(-)